MTDVSAWPLQQGDVRDIDWSGLTDRIDLLAGGPPCQPFAIGGKKNGHNDARDMWPEAIRAVRETRPTVFVWENV
ncbi:DNA cytosine methyltransferase, partial [Escherichia coli]|uniref:DNA cytosine methyltransferase n=1 Tax=Escherichia coli TaxID=562 RepID=UPI0028DF49EE